MVDEVLRALRFRRARFHLSNGRRVMSAGVHFSKAGNPLGSQAITVRTVQTLALAFLSLTFALAMILALSAAPRRTGDSHQYIAMAMQFSELRPPSLSPVEESSYVRWLTSQPAESGFPDGARAIQQPALIRDGRQEFSHFWLYPLLVSPVLRLTNALGEHPLTAFTIANGAMLGTAIWAASRAFGAFAAVVLLASPIVWFIGRAQVEAFTVALLTLAMAAAASRHWGWASIAVAIASTQNVPIAGAMPLLWAGGAVDWPLGRRSKSLPLTPERYQVRRALAFATAGLAIALLHPLYYLYRLGVVTPQQLNGGIAGRFPSLNALLAPIVDPDIGFLAWLPITAALGVAGAAIFCRSLSRCSAASVPLALLTLCAAIIAIWFLFVFAQTTNANSGGTVHISRYALWLLPLALPAIAVSTGILGARWPNSTLAAAALLCAIYLAYFHPDQPERYVEHSPQASLLMSMIPALYHPLPEVFVERTLHVDGGPRASAAGPGCQLIFLLADHPEQPCPIAASARSDVDRLFSDHAAAVWIRVGSEGSADVSPALSRR